MGFLGIGGSKDTSVSTSAMRMIDDEHLPNVYKQGLVSYLFSDTGTSVNQGGLQLSDYIASAAQSSAAVRWNKAYKYAVKKPDNYYYGVPRGNAYLNPNYNEAPNVQETIEEVTGRSITMRSSLFSSFNPYHMTWFNLQRKYGYSFVNNELTTLTNQLGTTVYLQDFVVHLTPATIADEGTTNNNFVDQQGVAQTFGTTQNRGQDLGRPFTPLDTNANTLNDYTTVTYTYRTQRTVVTTDVTTTVSKKTSSTDTKPTSTTDTKTSTTSKFAITVPTTAIEQGVTSPTSSTTSDTKTTTSADGLTTTTVVTKKTTRVEQVDFFDTFTMDFLDFRESNGTGNTLELDYPLDSNFYMVIYQYVNSSGGMSLGAFTYRYGAGDYPDLDNIQGEEFKDLMNYYPRFYARIDRKLNDPSLENTAPYITSEKTFAKLGMGWSDWVDALHDSIDNTSIVKHLYMHLALPLNTQNKLEIEYLWTYFQNLYDAMTTPLFNKGLGNPAWAAVRAKAGQAIAIEDRVMTIQFYCLALGYATFNGVTGPVGTFTAGFTQYPDDLYDGTYHYFRKQINATQYLEVRVLSAETRQDIGGKVAKAFTTDEDLLIPLDRSLRTQFSIHERETLISRAMYIVVNTSVTTKKKWYQTGAFQNVVIVMSVVLSYWTAGASLSLAGILQAVVVAAATQLALQLANKYIFSKIGGAFGTILAVAAVVVAVYAGYVSYSGTTGPMNVTAQNMIAASNAAFSEVGMWNKSQLAEIQESFAKLQDEISSKQDVLNQAKSLLNSNPGLLDPNVFLNSVYDLFPHIGEDPSDYYERTIHSGNVGVGVFDFISGYSDLTLSLPTFQQTMSRISGGSNG